MAYLFRGAGQKELLRAGLWKCFVDCPECPKMVVVLAGSFIMGSPESEPERRENEGPQHGVTFARPFAVGKFAVTFSEWDACTADKGCGGYRPGNEGLSRPNFPVVKVSWDDAQAYVAWLSKKTGKTYRLLSEAEREYVARAGTKTPFWWGMSITPKRRIIAATAIPTKAEARRRNCLRPLPVELLRANPWGLFQVHGNVWEWVEDCWNGRYGGAPQDGSAWTTGPCDDRVLRGGGWVMIQGFSARLRASG